MDEPDREFDRWFQRIVVKPRIEAWGSGWDRLSEEVQKSELESQCWTVIQNSDRVDNIDDPIDAAIFGRHVARVASALQRYLASRGQG